MKGQSGYMAPRSGGPIMKGIPQPQGGFAGPASMGPMAMPKAPIGMATRSPVIANKARGTQASHTYSQIPNSMSGMGYGAYNPPTWSPKPSGPSGMVTPLKGGTRVGKSLPTFLQ